MIKALDGAISQTLQNTECEVLDLVNNSSSGTNISPSNHLTTKFYRVLGWLLLAFLAHEALLIVATILPPVRKTTIVKMAFQSHQYFWFQWDSLWYISIGKLGYTHLGHLSLSSLAFFPFVPLLVRIFGQWTVLVLGQVAFAATLVLLNIFAERLGFTRTQSIWAVWLFALNPAAIFYSTIYAEPWTILCVLGSVLLGTRKRFVLAGLVGLCAAMTQGTGILVGLFPLILFVWSLIKKDYSSLRGSLIWGIGCALGLAAYMAYLGYAFHNPLAFSEVQKTRWQAHWAWPWYEYTWVIRYMGIGIHHKLTVVYGLISLIDVVGILLFCIGKLNPFNRWEAIAAKIYGIVGALVSLSFVSGAHPFWSTLRIISVYFPIYLGWAMQKRRLAFAVTALFTCMAFIGASYFSHGYFYQ